MIETSLQFLTEHFSIINSGDIKNSASSPMFEASRQFMGLSLRKSQIV